MTLRSRDFETVERRTRRVVRSCKQHETTGEVGKRPPPRIGLKSINTSRSDPRPAGHSAPAIFPSFIKVSMAFDALYSWKLFTSVPMLKVKYSAAPFLFPATRRFTPR
jgi:hypothetical protein